MAIDQTELGAHVARQMEAIEEALPENGNIGAIVTLVEVGADDGEGGHGYRALRMRANVPPHVAIGLLEEAKQIQLGLLRGESG